MLPEYRQAAEAMLDAQRSAERRRDEALVDVETSFYHVVTACRAHKMAWSDIAHALGMPSADAARVRYARTPRPTDAPAPATRAIS